MLTKEEIKQFKREAEEFGAEVQKYDDLHQESYGELVRLKSSRQEATGRKQQEINQLLDNLPVDLSAKGALDRIYKLKPDPSTRQLDDNIEKLEASCLLAKRKKDQAAGKKAGLENEIFQNEVNNHTNEVFRKFYKWLGLYRAAKDYFHNDLIPSIEKGYQLDRFFQTRCDELNLSKTVAVSIESHFRDGSLHVIGMAETIEKISNLGGSYGEALLDKEPSSTEIHPMEDTSYFGLGQSDKPPWQDPK